MVLQKSATFSVIQDAAPQVPARGRFKTRLVGFFYMIMSFYMMCFYLWKLWAVCLWFVWFDSLSSGTYHLMVIIHRESFMGNFVLMRWYFSTFIMRIRLVVFLWVRKLVHGMIIPKPVVLRFEIIEKLSRRSIKNMYLFYFLPL